MENSVVVVYVMYCCSFGITNSYHNLKSGPQFSLVAIMKFQITPYLTRNNQLEFSYI